MIHGLTNLNPLNAELSPIYHLLALLGAHLIFHVSRIRVKFTVFTRRRKAEPWVRVQKLLVVPAVPIEYTATIYKIVTESVFQNKVLC